VHKELKHSLNLITVANDFVVDSEPYLYLGASLNQIIIQVDFALNVNHHCNAKLVVITYAY